MPSFRTAAASLPPCRSLVETNRNVYRENGGLIEAIRVYKQEFDQLQKTKDQLSKLISRASGDKELNEILIKEKVEQIQRQNNTIKEVRPGLYSSSACAWVRLLTS